MTSSLGAWRLALILALRDLRRYKGRSALAALLIFAPVLAMAALLTGIQTGEVGGTKQNAQHLTAAAASVQFENPDPNSTAVFPAAGRHLGPGLGQPTAAQVSAQAHAPAVRETTATLRLAPAPGGPTFFPVDDMRFLQTDLASPLVRPTTSLDSGRWPQKPGEVVVTRRGLIAGLPRTGTLEATYSDPMNPVSADPAGKLTVVGTVTSSEGAELMGPTVPSMAARSETPEFLIAGKEWRAPTIREWTAYGADVTTRSSEPVQNDGLLSGDGDRVAFAMGTMGFVAVTALLAGPAFAASATRQRRTLGLVAANGATRAVLRRIVLVQALVLGSLTAAVSILCGTAVGVLAAKWGHLHYTGSPAPTDIPVRWLFGVFLVSALASLVAAAVPARRAGRTDLLAALRGQVSSRVVRKRWPILGVIGIAAGTGCLVLATNRMSAEDQGTPVLLAYIGVPLFFGGAVLAVPFFLALTGRLARYLPVTARIAVRDVSRQRTRATASIGAVLATVAVLCAGSIFGASVDAYTKKHYTPAMPVGSGAYTPSTPGNVLNGQGERAALASLPRIRQLVPRATPLWEATTPDGIPRVTAGSCTAGSTANDPFAGVVLVALDSKDIDNAGFTPPARETLTSGGAVVMDLDHDSGSLGTSGQLLDSSQITNGRISLRDQNPVETTGAVKQQGCRPLSFKAVSMHTVPKHLGSLQRGSLVVSRSTLDKAGLPATLLGISLDPDQPISTTTEHRLAAITPIGTTLAVERGYHSKLQRILGIITVGFALIVLLTTIVSTLLNDAESQSDMATLAATGAPRSMRRRVVGAHAAAIGFIGALAGIIVGFVPGLVLARASTTTSWVNGRGVRGSYAVAWWPLVAMLLLVPLIAALISMLFARRTPPLTRREA